MTNTNSTIANAMPSVGADSAPPELLASVDPDFHPKDSLPENTDRMMGGAQKGDPGAGEAGGEMDVGELEGASFKVEPLRRTGEDANTMRARLVCMLITLDSDRLLHGLANDSGCPDQSRKRGTLESDLLLSTFADTYLPDMSMEQMSQYDRFLDENDWDIYYWATQEPTPTSRETAEGNGPEYATPNAQGVSASSAEAATKGEVAQKDTDAWRQGKPRSGEWAQTVGTFKPAYRPVPARWKNSEVLSMLRRHVLNRSAGGVHEEEMDKAGKDAGMKGQGLGRMPEVKNLDV
jgi:hypothetical protein